MDNARVWAAQTSFDLEHWSMDDWSATNSIEQNRAAPASGHHAHDGGSAAALLEPDMGMLGGSNFTPIQMIELENVIDRTMQRSLQRYFEGAAGNRRAGGRWGLNADARESGAGAVGRNQAHPHSFRLPPNFAALKVRSSLRQPRGLHRLQSNEDMEISENMNSESNKESQAVKQETPPPVAATDLNGRSILVVIGGFFAYFATFGKSNNIISIFMYFF
jgi:hypothetical protein